MVPLRVPFATLDRLLEVYYWASDQQSIHTACIHSILCMVWNMHTVFFSFVVLLNSHWIGVINIPGFFRWWRHEIETPSTILTLRGNHRSLVDYLHKGPVMWIFDIFFSVCLNKKCVLVIIRVALASVNQPRIKRSCSNTTNTRS